MKKRALMKIMGMSLISGGVFAAASFPLAAQETAPQHESASGHMQMHGMMGKQQGMMGDMEKMHEQMDQMDQEMNQELQKQLTTLRAHAKTMEGMTDEKQLLSEMKKHQQMTD